MPAADTDWDENDFAHNAGTFFCGTGIDDMAAHGAAMAYGVGEERSMESLPGQVEIQALLPPRPSSPTRRIVDDVMRSVDQLTKLRRELSPVSPLPCAPATLPELAAQEASDPLAAQGTAYSLDVQEATDSPAAQEVSDSLAAQGVADSLDAKGAADSRAAQEASESVAAQGAADSLGVQEVTDSLDARGTAYTHAGFISGTGTYLDGYEFEFGDPRISAFRLVHEQPTVVVESRFFTFGYRAIEPITLTCTDCDGTARLIRAIGVGDAYIVLDGNRAVQVPGAYFCPDAGENAVNTSTLAKAGIGVSPEMGQLRFPDHHTLIIGGSLHARPVIIRKPDGAAHNPQGQTTPTASCIPPIDSTPNERSAYELQRNNNIARNNAVLSTLGLQSAPSNVPSRPKTPRIRKRAEPGAPTRSSARVTKRPASYLEHVDCSSEGEDQLTNIRDTHGTPLTPTEVAPSSGRGLGLFARTHISPNTVVARFRRTATVARNARVGAWRPHDSIVYSQRSQLKHYDAGWARKDDTPEWYRLNHAADPNVQGALVDSSVAWVTTRSVPAGAELFIQYDNAPPWFV